MKKLLIICTLCAIAFNLSAQNNLKTTVFTLDLGRPTSKSMQSSEKSRRLILNSNNLLAFELLKANPFKYSYSIDSNPVDFFNNKGYNPLDSVNLFINKSTKTNSNNGTSSAAKKLLTTYSNISTSLAISPKIESIDVTDNNKDIIKQQLQHAKYVAFDPKKVGIPVLKNLINKENATSNILGAIEVLLSKSKSLVAETKNYINIISSEDYLNKVEFVKKRNELNSENILLHKEISSLNKEANSKLDDPQLKTYQNTLKDLNAETAKINQEIKKLFQVKLHNYLLPVDIDGENIDLVEIKVERTNKLNPNTPKKSYTYNIWIKGGIKIDISGGGFITSLKDDEYFTTNQMDNGTLKKKIFRKNDGDYDFGFGSMINISPRTGTWIKPTVNVGALFTANQKFQILGGGGLIFGKKERVVLHAGLAMGAVSRISKNLNADGETLYDLGENGQVPTTEKFSFGHFFGLTYNFGKVKSQAKK